MRRQLPLAVIADRLQFGHIDQFAPRDLAQGLRFYQSSSWQKASGAERSSAASLIGHFVALAVAVLSTLLGPSATDCDIH